MSGATANFKRLNDELLGNIYDSILRI